MFPILSLLLCGSPVPPPIAPATPAHMVGSWEYDWGQMRGGRVVFGEAGWYVSRHTPECPQGYSYLGRWEWDGRTLVLWEWSICDGWRANGPRRYEVDFGSPRGYELTGRSENGTVVRIAKLPEE